MVKAADQPPDAPVPGKDWVALRVWVPRDWRDSLAESAGTQGISMSALIRIVLRGYLRERYNGEGRAALGAQS